MAVPRRTAKDEALRTLQQVVEPLSTALGAGNEVVLHDLRHMDHSVIAINGDITNRPVGAPITDLILQHLQTGHREHLVRYRTRTKAGRQLLSSTIFIRDESGEPFGCLCINTDITDWLRLGESVRALTKTNDPAQPGEVDDGGDGGESSETFVPSVEDLTVNAVNRAIESIGVPVEYMRKEHRTEVIKKLEASGFFMIQDAVIYVANALHISRHSVYNYLHEMSGDGNRGTGRQRSRRATSRQLPISRESNDG